MKLKIQLFAADTITYDEATLVEAQNELNEIDEAVTSAMETINQQIDDVVETSTDQETQNQLQEVTNEIDKEKNGFSEAFAGLSSVISSALEIFNANKSQFSSEIKAWIESFNATVNGIKKAYTAEGATQGVETIKTATQEIVSSGIKISGYTRGIVTEAVNMLASGGKLIKGVTGNSPQQLVQKGIGTIATLFNSGKTNPGGTIISQLVGKLGQGFSSWITGKVA